MKVYWIRLDGPVAAVQVAQSAATATIIKNTMKKTDYWKSYCSDFRKESNGLFVLGVGFFFFRQISTF